jgi:zinc protease
MIRRVRPLAAVALGAALFTAGGAHAAAAPAAQKAPQKTVSVEGITEYRLDNGLRVLLFPDASKATTTVNMTYLVGSRHEGYGETGMAHLLEHMVFKGSPRHTNIPQELTSHGARPNGSTWYDRTNYFETFAATDENLDWALDLEADRMVNSFIRPEDLASEFSVVRNEFESGENDPQGVLIERILSTMYLWHNYGKSTIGSRADIEKVPVPRLRAFYEKYYQPDNAVLIVAGKFDEAKTLSLVAQKFGSIPKPTRVLDETYTTEPAQDGERRVELRRVGDTQFFAAGFHVPAASHPDFAAVEVLSFVLSDTPAGRMHKSMVETQQASQVFGWVKDNKEPTFFLLGAALRKEKSLDTARDTLFATIEDVKTNAPSEQEVQRAKDSLLKDWETTLRNSERAAIALSEWVGTGDWRLMFLHRDRLETVKPADVSRVAQAYLVRGNRTLGEFYPTEGAERVDIPATPNVAALTKFYKGREAMAQGEAFDPSPAAVEGRLERSKLASGTEVTLLPKKTRGATVNVALQIHLGSEAALQNRGIAGEQVPPMMLRGTAKHTRQELQDELDRLKTQLQVNGNALQANATIETTRENLPAALRLLAEVLRQPTFPESEFELLRQESLTQVEEANSDPQQKAVTAFQRHMDPWPASDPRYVETPEESLASLKAVKLADVKAFHADFYGAGAAEIAVVGDFDKAEVSKLLGELFGDWKSKQPFARLVATAPDRAALVTKIEAPDKENAFFVAGQRLALRDDDADYPALVLGNFMTGGGFLNSRLSARLRQKEGYSYGAGSQLQASSFDKDGAFLAFAIYAPQNGDKLQAAFLEEIEKVLATGFTEQEIAEAKTGYLQQRQVSRGMDRELARTLVQRSYQDRTLTGFDAVLETKVQALTNADIQAALKARLQVKKLSMVQSGDFAKAAKSGQ